MVRVTPPLVMVNVVVPLEAVLLEGAEELEDISEDVELPFPSSVTMVRVPVVVSATSSVTVASPSWVTVAVPLKVDRSVYSLALSVVNVLVSTWVETKVRVVSVYMVVVASEYTTTEVGTRSVVVSVVTTVSYFISVASVLPVVVGYVVVLVSYLITGVVYVLTEVDVVVVSTSYVKVSV